MKALFITSVREGDQPGQVEVREIPKPEPTASQVRIKTAYASICGSDSHIVGGDLGPMKAGTQSMLPMRVGHEMSGIIDKVGEEAAALGFKVGDRIVFNYAKYCYSCTACRSGKENFCSNIVFQTNAMAEYICADTSQVFKIPDSLDLRKAVLVEPLTIAVGCVEIARPGIGKTVAIMGAGGIGIMIAMLAKRTGATHVTVFDIMPEKRKLALEMGADAAYDPTVEGAIEEALEATDGIGFDCVFEGTGNLTASKQTLRLLAPDGDCVYYAMYGAQSELPVDLFADFYWNQKHLHGMKMGVRLFPKTIKMAGEMDLEPLIQIEYPFSQYKQAFDSMLSKKYAKVVLKMDE